MISPAPWYGLDTRGRMAYYVFVGVTLAYLVGGGAGVDASAAYLAAIAVGFALEATGVVG